MAISAADSAPLRDSEQLQGQCSEKPLPFTDPSKQRYPHHINHNRTTPSPPSYPRSHNFPFNPFTHTNQAAALAPLCLHRSGLPTEQRKHSVVQELLKPIPPCRDIPTLNLTTAGGTLPGFVHRQQNLLAGRGKKVG